MFNNILASVKDAASNVAKTIDEQNRQNQQNQGQHQSTGFDSHNPKSDVEETVGKVDSKDGKVQLSSIQDGEKASSKETSKKDDFLSGLVNVAQHVGNSVAKSIEEQNRLKEQQQKQGSVASDNVEDAVGKIDSKGGKVQVTTVQDGEKKIEQKEPSKGSDFLAGLVNVAQDIGKYVEKSKQDQRNQNPHGAPADQGNVSETAGKIDSQGGKVQVATVADGASGAAGLAEGKKVDGVNFSEDDLKALGQNIGGIVSGLFKKDASKPGEVTVEEFTKEAVIDDIEGEIAVVKTSGYTAVKKQ